MVRVITATSSHLVLTVGVTDARDGVRGEQVMEGGWEEGKVAHERVVLSVHHTFIKHVGETEPVETRTHPQHTGVLQLHTQEVIVQTLTGETNSN